MELLYLTHSATLFLLFEAFSSLTFKAIIDRYVLIAILLFFVCFYSSLLLSSSLVHLSCDLMTFLSFMLVFLSLSPFLVYLFSIYGYHEFYL